MLVARCSLADLSLLCVAIVQRSIDLFKEMQVDVKRRDAEVAAREESIEQTKVVVESERLQSLRPQEEMLTERLAHREQQV